MFPYTVVTDSERIFPDQVFPPFSELERDCLMAFFSSFITYCLCTSFRFSSVMQLWHIKKVECLISSGSNSFTFKGSVQSEILKTVKANLSGGSQIEMITNLLLCAMAGLGSNNLLQKTFFFYFISFLLCYFLTMEMFPSSSKFRLISAHESIIPAVETWGAAVTTAVICRIPFLNHLSTIINVFTGSVMLLFQLLQCSRK